MYFQLWLYWLQVVFTLVALEPLGARNADRVELV